MIVRVLRLLSAAALAVGLTACASTPYGQRANVSVSEAANLPRPTRDDLRFDERPYYLGPYDRVAIDVFGMPEMQRVVQVDASGRIAFPLAGVVEVAGITPFELGRVLEERLRASYVRNPQVTVNLEAAQSQFVTVSGEVENPGPYPVIGRMTLSRAIARAGGLSDFAERKDVVVMRTVDGREYIGLYNLEGIRRGNYEDPEVFSNDMVIVGESRFRRLFSDTAAGTALLSPFILLLR